MTLSKEILFLIRKEFILEFRQKYAISGILLYVLSTVFIVFASFFQLPKQVWHTMFWVITLFAAINAIVKSFVQESGSRQLYYYQLVSPHAVLISKMIYNALLLLTLSILTWFALGFIAGNPVRDLSLFSGALCLSALGFSITLTFVSAIAAKASNNATLLAILGFPLIIPILMTLIKLSANAVGLLSDTAYINDVYILISIDMLLLALAIFLFPYLWRD
ncbi:MAG: heme exporter protein CcmB [Saprospiraceae bacterium]